MLALILLIMDGSFDISAQITSTLFPRPASAPLSGPDLFYIQSLPLQGKILVDGQPVKDLPQVQHDLPLRLPAGSHTIEWQTKPFQAFRCLVSIPQQGNPSACPFQTVTNPNHLVRGATLILPPAPLSLGLLPDFSRETLVKAVQQKLDTLQATTTIHHGQAYLFSQGKQEAQIAQKPLAVLQSFLLETDTNIPAQCQGAALGKVGDPPCFLDGQDCRLFCTILQSGNSSAPFWDIAAIVRPFWTLSATDQQQNQHTSVVGAQQFSAFRTQWQSGNWHVTFQDQGTTSFDDPNCVSTFSSIVSNEQYQREGAYWSYISSTNRADGCVAIRLPSATAAQEPTLSLSSGPVLLQRFGVLLAVNDDAAKQWDHLPRATQEESHIAEDILDHPVFTS